jgi:hypothetical protein
MGRCDGLATTVSKAVASKLQLTKPEQNRAGRWLLVRGRGEQPLPATGWALERHGSSRRPTVQEGDVAICYASVWQAIFAVVEVVSAPEHDPARERWAWTFAIRQLAGVRDLHDAPACEQAGISPSSLWRHSYIRLDEQQFAEARRLIEAARDCPSDTAVLDTAEGLSLGPLRSGRVQGTVPGTEL